MKKKTAIDSDDLDFLFCIARHHYLYCDDKGWTPHTQIEKTKALFKKYKKKLSYNEEP